MEQQVARWRAGHVRMLQRIRGRVSRAHVTWNVYARHTYTGRSRDHGGTTGTGTGFHTAELWGNYLGP